MPEERRRRGAGGAGGGERPRREKWTTSGFLKKAPASSASPPTRALELPGVPLPRNGATRPAGTRRSPGPGSVCGTRAPQCACPVSAGLQDLDSSPGWPCRPEPDLRVWAPGAPHLAARAPAGLPVKCLRVCLPRGRRHEPPGGLEQRLAAGPRSATDQQEGGNVCDVGVTLSAQTAEPCGWASLRSRSGSPPRRPLSEKRDKLGFRGGRKADMRTWAHAEWTHRSHPDTHTQTRSGCTPTSGRGRPSGPRSRPPRRCRLPGIERAPLAGKARSTGAASEQAPPARRHGAGALAPRRPRPAPRGPERGGRGTGERNPVCWV